MLSPFRLKQPIGPDSVMDRDDVLNTKRALNALGFLDAPDYGLTPYPDAPMIAAVENFQRLHGLRVDGIMNPDGPTLNRLNEVLAARQAKPTPLGVVESQPPETSPPPRKPNEGTRTAAAGVAIPTIAGQLPRILGSIAGMLGLTLPLGRDTPKEDERERRCGEQLEQDSEKCRQVRAKHGPQAAQRCWASANLRYGNCLAGRPVPDLDEGTD